MARDKQQNIFAYESALIAHCICLNSIVEFVHILMADGNLVRDIN